MTDFCLPGNVEWSRNSYIFNIFKLHITKFGIHISRHVTLGFEARCSVLQFFHHDCRKSLIQFSTRLHLHTHHTFSCISLLLSSTVFQLSKQRRPIQPTSYSSKTEIVFTMWRQVRVFKAFTGVIIVAFSSHGGRGKTISAIALLSSCG